MRLRYGYVVTCTGADRDADGTITAVHCDYLPDTKSGTPGADSVKVKGNIHWVCAAHAYEAEVRLYDRLFTTAQPGAATGDFLRRPQPRLGARHPRATGTQPARRRSRRRASSSSATATSSPTASIRKPGAPVFNRTVTLKDSWTEKREVDPDIQAGESPRQSPADRHRHVCA